MKRTLFFSIEFFESHYICHMRNENLKNEKDDLTSAEKELEKVLRPADFQDFTGQEKFLWRVPELTL